MILNVDLVYAEFLEHFLKVIQEEHARNEATLVSGFLRSEVLSLAIEKVCTDQSYIPLSSVIKAGLVDKSGAFCTRDEPRAERVKLYFDKVRTQGVLQQLGIDDSQFSEIQQLIFVTCCQEAVNRVITGPFRLFSENVDKLSKPSHQEQIIAVLKQMTLVTLGSLASALQFNPSDTSLSAESILVLKRKRVFFLNLAKENPGLDIPDEELTQYRAEPAVNLSAQERVKIYDELIPTLAIDPSVLNADEQLEHEAKLRLLKLHSIILAMTVNDEWQVKGQWLKQGSTVAMTEQTVKLPHSVSQILETISLVNEQKHRSSYRAALKRIQKIAKEYEQDWYTWGRNQLPLVCSSPAVKKFLNLVLSLDLDKPSPIKAVAKKEAPVQRQTALAEWVDYGLSFFGAPPATAETAQTPKTLKSAKM
jgi:hypothetical protein